MAGKNPESQVGTGRERMKTETGILRQSELAI